MKDFEGLDRKFRQIVFYSEGAGDWPHLGPVVEALLHNHEREVTYLASDPADPGLAIRDPRLRTFLIGSGTVRTILFARLDCAHFVMTLPDLGALWLKRSVHPVHYVYLFHSMNSTHAAYRKGAFDHYDTILCVGPYHVDEIRKTEALDGLPPKNLVEHGSVKLDTILSQVGDRGAVDRGQGPATVLVAPTWGDSSLIERPVGLELLDTLIRTGYRTVLRLHPMTVRRLPDLVATIRDRYQHQPIFHLEEDMNAIESWLRSDVMISDWSGAAIEYALALGRPIIYVDTPQKAVNPAWRDIDAVPFEDMIRSHIGSVVDPTDIATLPNLIEAELARPNAGRADVASMRARWVFNVGRSSLCAADYLASILRSR
jgi:hypothetical protein